MVHLPTTASMKALSLIIKNTAQKNLLEESPLGFALNFGASSKGYLLHAETYCGVDIDLPDTGLDRDADVVLGLIEKSEVKTGSTVTFDLYI